LLLCIHKNIRRFIITNVAVKITKTGCRHIYLFIFNKQASSRFQSGIKQVSSRLPSDFAQATSRQRSGHEQATSRIPESFKQALTKLLEGQMKLDFRGFKALQLQSSALFVRLCETLVLDRTLKLDILLNYYTFFANLFIYYSLD
jgi:hypothetical protein